MPEDKAVVESGAADRLLFFSDAVVAIAITLLAFELPVPTGSTTEKLWTSVRHSSDHYLSFLIGFVVIAAAWSQHHHVFRYAERSDARLRTCNMAWLLTIILNPFATSLLTSGDHDSMGAHALRFGFYALLQALEEGAFLVMMHHMISHHLQAPDTPDRLWSDVTPESRGRMLGFALSIPIFFAITWAWSLWIAVPLALRQLRRIRDRPRRRAAVSR